jgi:catechol 2,3-dioxygenase-like lactoylglutathione lyase family enzyme
MTSTQRRTAADRDLRLLRLDHFTAPVRDLNVARKFYCEVLGGVVKQEPTWDRHNSGLAVGAHIDIQLFDGDGYIIGYWQPWGQPAPDQMFPHKAFRVADPWRIDDMMARLNAVRVPYVLVTSNEATDGAPVPISLYFRDPDGNQLELCCGAYPFRPGIHVGPFDPTQQYYRWADWRALVPDGGAPPGRPRPKAR